MNPLWGAGCPEASEVLRRVGVSLRSTISINICYLYEKKFHCKTSTYNRTCLSLNPLLGILVFEGGKRGGGGGALLF